MIIKEYRVTLPLTVEEYQVAQLYSVAEASKNNTGGGEGIEVRTNEPFELEEGFLGGKYKSGQYTYKIYHLASRVPTFITAFFKKGSLDIHEEAWNAYPYCKTVITNPGYMADSFTITIESLHIADRGEQNNVHELSSEKLKMRTVEFIDIANDPINAADYKEDEDPTIFKSTKTGRGPLVGRNWKNEVTPVMTCYKLVTCEFKWMGFTAKVESYIQKTEKRLFTNFHRQVFCWTDRWYGLTMEDIRAIEERTKKELDVEINQGTVKGIGTDTKGSEELKDQKKA